MKCDFCGEHTDTEILAIRRSETRRACKDCANAIVVNRELFRMSVVEPMPKRFE